MDLRSISPTIGSKRLTHILRHTGPDVTIRLLAIQTSSVVKGCTGTLNWLLSLRPVWIASIAPSPLALSPAKAKRGPATFTATMINHQNVPFDGRFMAAANTTDNWPNGTVIRLAAGEKKTITYTYAPPADANLADSNFLSFWVDGLKMRSPRDTVRVCSTKAVTVP